MSLTNLSDTEVRCKYGIDSRELFYRRYDNGDHGEPWGRLCSLFNVLMYVYSYDVSLYSEVVFSPE